MSVELQKESERATVSAWVLLRRFAPFVRPYSGLVLIGLLVIPIITGVGIWRPLLLKRAVDQEIPTGDVEALMITAAVFLGAVVLEYLCTGAQMYCLQRAGHSTIRDVRRSVFSHILRLPASYFDKNPVGVLVSRTTSDVDALSETLSFGVFTIISDVILIAGTVVTMFILSPRLTLLTLAVAPVLFIVIRLFSQVLRGLQLEIRKAQGNQIGYMTEQLAGVSVLQLFGREDSAKQRYAELGQRYLKAIKRANIFDATLFSIMDGLSALTVAALIYFAAPAALGDTGSALVESVSLGLLFAFVDYLQRVFVPIREFSGKVATVQRASAALERIFGVLDEAAETRGPPSPKLSRWTGALRVRDLYFSYSKDGPDILKGVNFSVQAGQVVAIVGRTGSGKTSLGRVLAQTYTGYRGSIELEIRGEDEAPATWHELRDFETSALRRELLMVQQDVFLFDDSVAFNVAMGDPALSDSPQAIKIALQSVQATAFVEGRGNLDFRVGERGKSLSAGETQLLAFARVAARAPKLLILDEATSNVDSATERKVQTAIEEIFKGRSVLVIAHRLSTVRNADQILVFDSGKIAESGDHDTLMLRAGIYANLYRSGLHETQDGDLD